MSINKGLFVAAAALALLVVSSPIEAVEYHPHHRASTFEQRATSSSSGPTYRDPTTREALDTGTW